jgi:hypothetical protein
VVSAKMRKERGRYFGIKEHVVGRKEKSVEEVTCGLRLTYILEIKGFGKEGRGAFSCGAFSWLVGTMGLVTAGLMVATNRLVSCWAYSCNCFDRYINLSYIYKIK